MSRPFCLVAVLVALACRPLPVPESTPDPLVLRTYEVLPEQEERLESALRSVLSVGEDPVGRVHAGPGGTLVVAAPRSVVDGVDGVIAAIAKAAPAPPPKNVEVRYWLVVGTRGEASAEPGLAAVADTLATIGKADGHTRFELVAQQQLTSLEGERAKASTLGDQRAITHFEQRIARDARSGAFVAEILVDDQTRFGSIETRVVLDPGQTVVLGTTGAGPTTEHDAAMYVLVRPTVR